MRRSSGSKVSPQRVHGGNPFPQGVRVFNDVTQHRFGCRSKLRLLVVAGLSLVLAVAAVGPAQAQREMVRVLISFTDHPGPSEQELIHRIGGLVKHDYHLVPVIAALIPRGALPSLRASPTVASIEEDVTIQALGEVVPWGVGLIGADVAHTYNKGRGVKVAILDTGIDLDHPDLAVAGNVTFVAETTSGDDDNGHGTMVAEVVAALDNDIGGIGVAPEVELYAIKVLDSSGAGHVSDILAGIEWAIENRMHVVNMSFGSYLRFPSAVEEAIDKAYRTGIILVAGSGSQGDAGPEGDNVLYPARYGSVIAVAATDAQGTRISSSSTGPEVELSAPGSSTSMAAPHVAGIAALLIASGLGSNSEVRQRLQQTAQDLGAPGRDVQYGYGLVNVERALEYQGGETSQGVAGDKTPPITIINLSPLSGDRGWYRSDVEVTLSAVDNDGGSGVAHTLYSVDGEDVWLTYQGPFIISAEGETLVLAKSMDKRGNVEYLPQYKEVKIDRTPPQVSITVSPSRFWRQKQKEKINGVLILGSAIDNASGSGLKSVRITVEDEYGQVEPSVSGFGTVVYLEAWYEGSDLDGRVYTFTATAWDAAGNAAIAQATVTILHDRANGAKY